MPIVQHEPTPNFCIRCLSFNTVKEIDKLENLCLDIRTNTSDTIRIVIN